MNGAKKHIAPSFHKDWVKRRTVDVMELRKNQTPVL